MSLTVSDGQKVECGIADGSGLGPLSCCTCGDGFASNSLILFVGWPPFLNNSWTEVLSFFLFFFFFFISVAPLCPKNVIAVCCIASHLSEWKRVNFLDRSCSHFYNQILEVTCHRLATVHTLCDEGGQCSGCEKWRQASMGALGQTVIANLQDSSQWPPPGVLLPHYTKADVYNQWQMAEVRVCCFRGLVVKDFFCGCSFTCSRICSFSISLSPFVLLILGEANCHVLRTFRFPIERLEAGDNRTLPAASEEPRLANNHESELRSAFSILCWALRRLQQPHESLWARKFS